MKPPLSQPAARLFFIPLLGLAGAGALLLADLHPLFRIVEANTIVLLPKMAWGGESRLWIAGGLVVTAVFTWALDIRRWSVLLCGAALGVQLDIVLSALAWRQEQFERLKTMGLADFEPTVEWKLGTYAFVAAFVLILLFFWRSFYPARPPIPPKDF